MRLDSASTGSGGASTSVFVSRDGGPFTQVGVTTRSSMNVPVLPGHTYTFFALAADSVGNIEEVRPEAVSTAVSVGAEEVDIPLQFALHGAYPNPFNPSTQISFELPRAGQVSLRLYNVLGQRLEVIDRGSVSPGRHTRSVDFTRYASGAYFYELRVSGPEGLLYRAIEKAVLVR